MTTRILLGDCRDVLRTLPDASVQMVCTSPPYYRLRSNLSFDHPGKAREVGQEPTPAEYVQTMIKIFRELHRVLRSNGVIFLNLGDTYATSGGAHDGREDNQLGVGTKAVHVAGNGDAGCRKPPAGFKVKDRMLIPARVAIALQEDGWWIRDEIIWHKPRPTPAPVLDRTVAAHEMIYLLTKQTRYYFDWAAIEEPATYREITVRETRRKRSVWSVSPSPYKGGHFSTMPPEIAEICILAGSRPGDTVLDPFYGAGTTGLVADRLQRNCIGIELVAEHNVRSTSRLVRDAGLFAEIAD